MDGEEASAERLSGSIRLRALFRLLLHCGASHCIVATAAVAPIQKRVPHIAPTAWPPRGIMYDDEPHEDGVDQSVEHVRVAGSVDRGVDGQAEERYVGHVPA